MSEKSDIRTQEVWIHSQDDSTLSPRLRPFSLKLPRLNTSLQKESNSNLSGSTAASSAAWTAHLQETTASPSLSPQSRIKKHAPFSLRKGLAHLDVSKPYSPQFLNSKATGIPSSPLSARTAAFLISVQHLLVANVDTYLHPPGSVKERPSPLPTPYRQLKSNVPNSPAYVLKPKTSSQPLTAPRKLLIAGLLVLLLALIILPIAVVVMLNVGSVVGQRVAMGVTPAVILLAAAIMVSARRSIKEILAMAAVGVTVCQCVMSLNLP
jgi:hypothetical protein